jgi:hypothetical protein
MLQADDLSATEFRRIVARVGLGCRARGRENTRTCPVVVARMCRGEE